MFLASGPAPPSSPSRPEDVAEAGLTFALRRRAPGVASLAKLHGCRRSAREWPKRRCLAFLRMLAKILKPEPRKCSPTSCISIGLRRSGLSLPYFDITAFGVGNERKLLRDLLAFAEFLEHATDHRLDCVENVLLRDEAHLEIELIEFPRRAIGARVFIAEARRDLEVAVEASRTMMNCSNCCGACGSAGRTCRDEHATARDNRAHLPATTL